MFGEPYFTRNLLEIRSVESRRGNLVNFRKLSINCHHPMINRRFVNYLPRFHIRGSVPPREEGLVLIISQTLRGFA